MSDELNVPVELARLPMMEALAVTTRLAQAGIRFRIHEEQGGLIALGDRISFAAIWVERDEEAEARRAMEEQARE